MKCIVLFGDSLLANINKTATLELQEKVPESVVYNCATAGFDTNDCLIRAPLICKMGADYIVISLGTNDAAHWKQVPLETFKANLVKIVDILKDSKLIYFLPPPVDEAKQETGKVRKNETVDEYREAIKLTLGNKVTYLNSDEFYGELLKHGIEYHVQDGVHLNEVAYSTLFDELSKIIF